MKPNSIVIVDSATRNGQASPSPSRANSSLILIHTTGAVTAAALVDSQAADPKFQTGKEVGHGRE
jgi:hypothetical protein